MRKLKCETFCMKVWKMLFKSSKSKQSKIAPAFTMATSRFLFLVGNIIMKHSDGGKGKGYNHFL